MFVHANRHRISLAQGDAAAWTRLADVPDPLGLAAPFAGVCRGALILAGGANFPGRKPWEGGTKVWYDEVYRLDRPDGGWRQVGRLPRALGYGVSFAYDDGLICAGGSDSRRHYDETFRLDCKDERLSRTELPPLPIPIANACGAVVNGTPHLAGGQESANSREALRRVFRLSLNSASPVWEEIEPLPGPGRILAAAGAADGAFWVIGGATLVDGPDGKAARRYLTDAYRFGPGRGWSRIADLPRPCVAAPSPVYSDAAGLLIFGGDDGSQVAVGPEAHRGFNRNLLRYRFDDRIWSVAGSLPAPRVTVPLVKWGSIWAMPSGEVRPGVRSPEVWSFSPR